MHGTMICCGREVLRRLYFILYRKIQLNRRVSNVCQPILLCMCVTLVARGGHVGLLRIGWHFYVFFQCDNVILGMWAHSLICCVYIR